MNRFSMAASLALPLLLLGLPSAASADDDALEFWIAPSLGADLDEDTGVQFETGQRLRSSEDGRADTYLFRLLLSQAVADNMALSGGVERRFNDGASNETYLLQRLSTSHGIVRARLQMEQRFVDTADRMGVRLRPRLGVSIPLNTGIPLNARADAELFLTLRSNNQGGDEGLTGLRTRVGLAYGVSERLGLSLYYLRQQSIEDGPDTIGHAPLIGVDYSF